MIPAPLRLCFAQPNRGPCLLRCAAPTSLRSVVQRPRPTAILVINDYIALDAMQYARQQKLKINKDICFVSYANLPITSYLENPPMASVEQYPYKQGAKAAEILIQLLSKADKPGRPDEPETFQNVVINGQLIVHSKK